MTSSSPLIITITPPVRTHNINALQIGGNLEYINSGLMRYELTNTLVPQLQAMFDYFSEHQPASALSIAVPGFVLDQLAMHEETSLAGLHHFLKSNKVNLLAMPFYGSSVALLTKDELTKQLELQEQRFKRLFKRKPKGFFAADNIVTPELESVLNERGYKNVFMQQSEDTDLTIANPRYSLRFGSVVDLSAFALQSDPHILVSPPLPSLAQPLSAMQEHLVQELKSMHDFITQTGDHQLLDDWRFLAHSSHIYEANVDTHPTLAYERYTGMMNILNDIAHRIRNIELTKQGVFAPDPNIVASPTTLLQELFST